MSLAVLLKHHGEALRADFRRFYTLDLLDLWRGRLGAQEAAALAVQLPPGAQVWREAGGPLAWSDEMHLLAEVEYGLAILAWQKTKAAQTGGNRPKRIQPPKPAAERRARLAELEAKARRFVRARAGRFKTGDP